ncbi:MAG: DUF4329 domain-containing protein [Pseudomonadota bacterium]
MRFLAVHLVALATVGAAHAQSSELVAAARGVLAQWQHRSFDADREFCGLIGIDGAGRFVATTARRGRRDSCTLPDFRGDIETVASVHTHGAYEDPGAEIPSPDDVLADADEGIDGFVATPGGRLWFVDGQRLEARLICGEGCLPQDPGYDSDDVGPVDSRYTLQGLERFLNE